MIRIPFINFFRKQAKQKRQKKFYSQFIRPGDLVFDIGANHGEYTEVFAQLGAKVIAVEPQQKCAALLRKKFPGNNQIIIEETAIGSLQGEVKLHIGNMDQVSTLSEDFIREYSRYDYLSWEKTETVNMTTLGALAEKYGIPAFVKIDTEGWDDEVLKGMNFRPSAISFEYVELLRKKTIACIELLNEAQFNFSSYENFRLEGKWKSSSEMKTMIENLPEEILHGDVFARLK